MIIIPEIGRKVRIDKNDIAKGFLIGTIGTIIDIRSLNRMKVRVKVVDDNLNWLWYDCMELSYVDRPYKNLSGSMPIAEYIPKGTPLKKGDYFITLSNHKVETCGYDSAKVGDTGYDFNYIRPTKDKNLDEDLSKYPLEDLITWRNTASARVSKIDKDIKYLQVSLQEYLMKWHKLTKKRKNDVKWIRKLNKLLNDRVFNKK